MTYPNLYQDIYHRYSGTVKVKHSSEATHAVDAHRAFLAYSGAAEAIGALLVKYAADIEVEAASRKAFAEEMRLKNEAEYKEVEAEIAQLKANPPQKRQPGFWNWLGTDDKDYWRLAVDHDMKISALEARLFNLSMKSMDSFLYRGSHEERQAQDLQYKMEQKSHLAYVVDGHLTLTTAEAIEMSKAEDGTLAEEIERMFHAMVMRNGETK